MITQVYGASPSSRALNTFRQLRALEREALSYSLRQVTPQGTPMPTSYAIDFDGTVVTHEYPKVGHEIPGAVAVLKALVARGDKLILWTMRSSDALQDAVDWFAERDLPLFGINENPEQYTWTTSKKAYAQVYIDDAGLGCPLVIPPKDLGVRPYVDWKKVAELVGLQP